VSGTTVQKIPYVFLPLQGQIAYPSAEIKITGTYTRFFHYIIVHVERLTRHASFQTATLLILLNARLVQRRTVNIGPIFGRWVVVGHYVVTVIDL